MVTVLSPSKSVSVLPKVSFTVKVIASSTPTTGVRVLPLAVAVALPAGAGKVTVALVNLVITPDVNPSCALLTRAIFVAPRFVKVATPLLAVAVVVPVSVHVPVSSLAAVTTVALSLVQVLP